MKPTVGTLEWARHTGGRLGLGDQAELLAQALRQQKERVVRGWKRQLGGPRPPPRLDWDALKPPDTPAARRAEALCLEVSPPYLAHHCLRAYVWARLLAARDGLRPDDEILYVSCLLHDLGLTPRYAFKTPGSHCFAIDGASALSPFAEEVDWDARRRDAVAEAIVLHLNVTVGVEHGVEAHLLHEATALDVTGQRSRQLAAEDVHAVVTRYPRSDFKACISADFRAQAERRPHCRAAFLERFGILGMVARAPFSE
ncbi:HD domain-containing protein [Myxococcaceae bacterium GXIMD 01537]